MSRIRPVCLALAAIVFWAGVGTAVAAVSDQSAAGFTSRSVHDIAAGPDVVWNALTRDIASWWNPAHTWSGDAANLFLVGEAGGQLGEKLADGGSVTHLKVIHAAPGRLLRLRGALGPLQDLALVGVLSLELAAHDGGTRLTVTYAVGGYAAGGLAALAGPVDGVIVEQFTRLKAFVER